LSFTPETRESLVYSLDKFVKANADTIFAPGATVKVELSLENFTPQSSTDFQDFKVNYALEVKYYDAIPPSVQSDLSFSVKQLFKDSQLGDSKQNGKPFGYQMNLQNLNSAKGMGMTVATFRLPACLDINYQQLDSLLGNKVVDKYEVINDSTEIVFYWRAMAPAEKKTFQLDFV